MSRIVSRLLRKVLFTVALLIIEPFGIIQLSNPVLLEFYRKNARVSIKK